MSKKNQKETRMIRKVQITGGSTYIISIPKEWVDELGIDKGLDVVMELTRDNALKVYSSKYKEKPSDIIKEIYINENLLDSAIIMEVISAYLAGYTSMKLIFSPLILNRVGQIINIIRNKVVGLEVLEENENSVTLHVVVDLSSIPTKLAIENMRKTFKSMLEDFGNAIKNRNEEIFNSIIKRDDVIDKLYLYIYKQINLTLQETVKLEDLGIYNSTEAINLYTIIKSIERIADHIVAMSTWILENINEIQIPEMLDNLITDVFKEVISVVDNIGTSQKANELLKVYSRIHELIEKELELIKSLKGSKQFYEIYPILDGLRRAMAYSIDIIEAQVGLNMEREINGNVKYNKMH
ncbi:MAG: phosphate uptake regulator PhoU, partial [Caldisphaera sp.]